MLGKLSRERTPGAALEDKVAQQLIVRGLVIGKNVPARNRLGRVAVTWPAAIAAALLLFVSGVAVGITSGVAAARGNAPAVASGNAPVAPHSASDLLLSADNRASVTRAIKF